MADNSQNIAAALAEAEQRVQQLKAQLAEAGGKGAFTRPDGQPSLKGQPATVRMAADMGARAAHGDQVVADSRFDQQGQRERIQAELRNRLLRFAMPGASPMQVDMARRGQAPPPVTDAASEAWRQAQESY